MGGKDNENNNNKKEINGGDGNLVTEMGDSSQETRSKLCDSNQEMHPDRE